MFAVVGNRKNGVYSHVKKGSQQQEQRGVQQQATVVVRPRHSSSDQPSLFSTTKRESL